MISILSSINLNEKIINLFDFDENDDLAFFQSTEFYQLNALDYFYSIVSFLSLGIPNQFFCNDALDEDAIAIILELAGILVSCDLILVTEEKNLVLTDIAKKFYVQLLLNNYTPTVNLLPSLIELANL